MDLFFHDFVSLMIERAVKVVWIGIGLQVVGKQSLVILFKELSRDFCPRHHDITL